MTITYSFKIRQLTQTTVYGLPDIISHVHFDYVGTNESGNKTLCQGVVPFELKPITVSDPANGKTRTIPAVFDKDNYTPYNQITDEIVIGWLNSAVPPSLIQTYQEIISQKLASQE
jgi:hypothetical protein